MRSLILPIALLSLAQVAVAQEEAVTAPPARQGFWFSLGAGLGSRGLSCDFCVGNEREGGFATNFKFGGAVGPNVTLAASLTGWITRHPESRGGRYGVFSSLMGVVQVYPMTDAGLFFQGGGGYIVDVIDDESVIDSPGITLGVGYDLRVGRNFSLTPQVNYLRTIDGNLVSSLYQFGLAATWH
jgi:hypothetical protein